ncbi:MAG TPA: DUF1775 domain-containing protein [Kofleriaceae bacterium]|jgi:uncharacterized protein YcnI
MSSKILLAAGVIAISSSAFAHISVGSGPAPANKSTKVTFNINHGCTSTGGTSPDQDTIAIGIDIPAGVTAVRPMPSDFGKPVVARDANSTSTPKAVTSVVWTKDDALNLGFDDAYYEITIKATLPNTPFAKLPFVIHQTCRNADNSTHTVDWVVGDPNEPAPNVVIVPAKLNTTGWNKFTIPASTSVAVTDFGAYFGDAQIVWKGSAAYTSNPVVAAALTTAGVAALGALAAGDEIMVKY